MHQAPFVRHKSLLIDPEDDPLAGVANLFDAAMVFAVALLLAFVVHAGTRSLIPAAHADAGSEADHEQDGVPTNALQTPTRFRSSVKTARGRGTRLGVAYRLESGKMIYVPDR